MPGIRDALFPCCLLLAGCHATATRTGELPVMSTGEAPATADVIPVTDADMQQLSIKLFANPRSKAMPTMLAVRNLGERGVRIVHPVTVYAAGPQPRQCEDYDPALDVAIWLEPKHSTILPVHVNPYAGDPMPAGTRIGVMVVDGADPACPARILWSENTFADLR